MHEGILLKISQLQATTTDELICTTKFEKDFWQGQNIHGGNQGTWTQIHLIF